MRPLMLKFNSLTFRLSLLFVITTIILLTATGTFLYRFLQSELMQRDHQELITKISLFRQQLSALDTTQQIIAEPNYFRDIIIGHPHLHLALLDAQGNIMLSSSDWLPPAELLSSPVAVDSLPDKSSMYMPTLDQPYHAIAAWSTLKNKGAGKVLIVLALDVDEAQNLLLRYRQTLYTALIFGALTAAVLAFIIVRRGLRPLHDMAEIAGKISASKLQNRLNVSHAPEELKELANSFNDMLGRLQQSFMRLSDFSADIAHELRTPINNLMGQTQVALSRTRDAAEYRAVLESNLEEHERLAQMIRDMLFLAKADNAQEPLHAERIDLRAELDKIAEFYQMAADEHGIKIITSGNGTLSADRILLQRAVGNLIANAVQHSPPNTLIHAIASTTAAGVELHISNEGKGIPAEKIARVFDRFYRADNAQNAGNGLGLAIVKSIMELHGGSVSVSSQPNRLTTFTLNFPRLLSH